MADQTIDYDALARQHGAVSSEPAGIDYDALAKQHGAILSEPTSQPRDLRNWASKAKDSAANYVGGMVNAAIHPLDTANNLKDVAVGTILNLAPGSKNNMPTPALKQASDKASAVGQYYKNRITHPVDTLINDPVGALGDVSMLAGGVSGVARSAGALADVANMPRLASAARTTANVAGNVAEYSNPVGAAGKAAAAIAGKVAPKSATDALAARMYQSALKPPPGSGDLEDIDKMVQGGLKEGVPVGGIGQPGLKKVRRNIGDIDQQVADRIKQGATAGDVVDPRAVVGRLSDTRKKFGNQVNAASDINAINSAELEFLKRFGNDDGRASVSIPRTPEPTPPPLTTPRSVSIPRSPLPSLLSGKLRSVGAPVSSGRVGTSSVSMAVNPTPEIPRALTQSVSADTPQIPQSIPAVSQSVAADTPQGFRTIPVDEAQALKQGTYAQLRKKYGELSSASDEAQKALARGLKEEVYAKYPELKDLGPREKVLIDLEEAMERYAKRHGNRDLVSFPSLISGGVGEAGAHAFGLPPGVGAAAGYLTKATIESPYVKSKLAIALAARGTPPGRIAKMLGAAPVAINTPVRLNDAVEDPTNGMPPLR